VNRAAAEDWISAAGTTRRKRGPFIPPPTRQAAKVADVDSGEREAANRALPGAEAVITVRGLRKRYGALEAVAGIDLEVRRGEIFAFLGPNGAGKTTTVEILEGFRTRSDGKVSVLGFDPARAGAAWRNRVGAVLQESQPEPGLTVHECLELYAGYYSSPRDIEETIALVGLAEKAQTLGEQLSGGQRRRLDVALALIGDPELIFLDEPTTGFDPSARRAAWSVIAGLRALGKTVFLTTHYMDEAENLADRIAVINAGRIVAEGTPRSLGGRERMAARVAFALPDGIAADELPDALRRLPSRSADGKTVLESEHPLVDVKVLADWALARDFDLPDLEVRRPSLEDVYLQLTESPEVRAAE
jgi:ABC-2 type transport system ATP-binding protein